MDVLVTGATGFLGGRLTRRLLDAGERVRVLVRDAARAAALARCGADAVRGDLRDRESVRAAVDGCAAVIHAGALSAPWGRRSDFLAVNVDGTRHVAEACRDTGARLVAVSSPAVLFDGAPHHDAVEDAPFPVRFMSAYAESKKLAEDVVTLAQGEGLSASIVRPKAIFGPGDTALLPRIVDAARRGRLVQIGDGANRVDLTYVDNVVEALVRARDDRRATGVYTITNGEHPQLWPAIRRVLEGLGISPRLLRVPVRAARAWARTEEWRAALTGREPLLTRYTAAILSTEQTYDISKARDVLGYRPGVTVDEGLELTIAAFREAR